MRSAWIVAIICVYFFAVEECGAQETTFKREGWNSMERIEQKFPVNPGGTLTIDADMGSIDIIAWTNNEVEVTLVKTLAGFSEDRAREAFEDVEVEISNQENDVRVQVEKKRRFGSNRVSVEMTVNVPESYNLDLKTSGGGVDISDLRGNVNARTSGGHVNIGHITEGRINAGTSGGNIRLSGGGTETELSTSGGDIEIGIAQGNVTATTSGGNIEIENAQGSVTATTSGGSIEIGPSEGDVNVRTSGGSIEIGASKGSVRAKTSGGNVKLGPTMGDIHARTSGGNIDIEEVLGTVDAKTHGGRVKIGPS